jgi:hypothetical protein
MHRLVVTATAVFASLWLSGCAATTTASDILTQGALEKSKTGVAVLKAQILGHGCVGGTITIAIKRDDHYEVVRTLQTIPGATAATNDVMSIELPPNEYHVVNVACTLQSGRTITTISLGNREGGVLGFGGGYKRSFATFRVATREVVNLGSLTVMSGVLGSAHLSISPLPTASEARFRQETPNLAKQMTTRLMVVDRAPLTPEQAKQVCTSYEALKSVLPSPGMYGEQDDNFDPDTAIGVGCAKTKVAGAPDHHASRNIVSPQTLWLNLQDTSHLGCRCRPFPAGHFPLTLAGGAAKDALLLR